MLGWEFPPFISGGLGTACFGITKALSQKDVEIVFVMPRIKGEDRASHVRLVSATEIPVPLSHLSEETYLGRMNIRWVDSLLKPYMNDREYRAAIAGLNREGLKNEPSGQEGCLHLSGDYGADLVREAVRYGTVAGRIAEGERFDVIHGHDWLTVFAGIEAGRASGKPFVYHAHALEFDRSGENINQTVYDIERLGMESADHVIAVSHYTKNAIVNRYGIPPDKITVVHNAVNREEAGQIGLADKREGRKIVLFLGRITFQKGPDYFIEAAALVLKRLPDVTFAMAGDGDMRPRMIERAARLGIGKNFHFLGFVSGLQVEQIYAMSDLYVMPSVSEPFGIAPLEAMLRDVPVIISRQSGVSEILRNVLKVDFWNTRELADKIISVLKRPALAAEMVVRSRESLRKIHWEGAAEKITGVYNLLIR